MHPLAPIVAAFSALVSLTGQAQASADDSIDVLFRNKPPYHYSTRGQPRGFLYDCTKRLFTDAGISARFEEEPTKRILQELQDNQHPVCSFGWYKIDERTEYAKFSQPIYQDRPQIIVALPDMAPRLRAHGSLRQIMKDADLRLGLLAGASYGADLDGLIARFPGVTDSATIEPLALAAKVASGRIHFAFLDQDDFDYLQSLPSTTLKTDFPGQADALRTLVKVEMPDMPQGLFRHILCNFQVPDAVMQALDKAIARRSCQVKPRE